jgi:head-tail adaptor
MQPFKYTPPRVRTGDLRTKVTFYTLVAPSGPMPSGTKEKKVLYSCWAKIDEVWMKDIVVAKADGTLSDLTITIRDTHGEFIPTNKMFVEVDAPEYKSVTYNIKQVMPDLQNRGFTKIVSGVQS